MPSIYKVSFPNGKIYIGSDVTDNLLYFGSPTNSKIYSDFEYKNDLILTKKILFYTKEISRKELIKLEMEYIVKYKSNNPEVGYNLIPKYRNNAYP